MQELAGALAGRRLELQQELDGARLKRGRALAAQLAIRWSLLENAGLLAFSQELLKEADPPCFLQAALPAHCRWAILPLFPPPARVSLYVLKQRKIKALLGKKEEKGLLYTLSTGCQVTKHSDSVPDIVTCRIV